MFRKDLYIKVNLVKTDDSGNFIILHILFADKDIKLVTIYAPNFDNSSFSKNNFDTIDSFDNNNSIFICGDYNLVQKSEFLYFYIILKLVLF